MAEQMTFMVEETRMLYPNFAGAKKEFNVEGDRNFCVMLDPDAADRMLADGWNVKYTKPRETDEGEIDEPVPYIKVKVSYKFRPPRITIISPSGVKTPLTEETVDILDYADIKHVDVICDASNWSSGNRSGISAYLKTLVVVIHEDPLEAKYGLNSAER